MAKYTLHTHVFPLGPGPIDMSAPSRTLSRPVVSWREVHQQQIKDLFIHGDIGCRVRHTLLNGKGQEVDIRTRKVVTNPQTG